MLDCVFPVLNPTLCSNGDKTANDMGQGTLYRFHGVTGEGAPRITQGPEPLPAFLHRQPPGINGAPFGLLIVRKPKGEPFTRQIQPHCPDPLPEIIKGADPVLMEEGPPQLEFHPPHTGRIVETPDGEKPLLVALQYLRPLVIDAHLDR